MNLSYKYFFHFEFIHLSFLFGAYRSATGMVERRGDAAALRREHDIRFGARVATRFQVISHCQETPRINEDPVRLDVKTSRRSPHNRTNLEERASERADARARFR